MKICFTGLFCLLALMVGCKSPGVSGEPAALTATDSDGSIRQASASSSERKILTFTDSETLQYDTGPIDENAATDFQMTESGLRYRILRESKGRKPSATNTVTVHYRGWLDSGKVFDSSYDRGEPISFPLNGVVAGWTEGLQLVGEGGMIELWIPARLGYGAAGSGGSVPPNATLHFIVELLKVK